MRCEMPHPCIGSRDKALRTSISSVPCRTSALFAATQSPVVCLQEDCAIPVECQEEAAANGHRKPGARLRAPGSSLPWRRSRFPGTGHPDQLMRLLPVVERHLAIGGDIG